MIVPIIIVFCILAYSAFNLVVLRLSNDTPLVFKIVLFVVLFIIAAVFIRLLIERIKEIKGEEDDLGKY